MNFVFHFVILFQNFNDSLLVVYVMLYGYCDFLFVMTSRVCVLIYALQCLRAFIFFILLYVDDKGGESKLKILCILTGGVAAFM